ncbi:MAG: hypothetical protein EOO99_02250 [Pedobacter sp.]|nr:MAG: hypothetical protein EOO99_02250 [Pedobacter sp.]
MKKYFVLVVTMLLLSGSAFSQRGHDNEKFEAAKVSFFNQKLGLSSDEAKIFWPIYNDYQKELEALRKAHMQKMISFRKVTEIDDMSDTQIQAFILNDFDFRQKDLNIEKKYYNKLKSSLPIKIVGKFYRAQEAFKRELLNQFRGGRPGGERRN